MGVEIAQRIWVIFAKEFLTTKFYLFLQIDVRGLDFLINIYKYDNIKL